MRRNEWKIPQLGFGRLILPHMAKAEYRNGRWRNFEVAPLQAAGGPALSALHYGQVVFEGLKAYPRGDGRWSLFRPLAHAQRLQRSSARLGIPEVPVELFLEAVIAAAAAHAPSLPSPAGSIPPGRALRVPLYLRPIVYGADEALGVRCAESYTFLVLATPAVEYFQPQEGLRLWVESEHSRAAPGGLGQAKTPANYAASLLAGRRAKERGFDDVLWLDSNKSRVEEAGAMNLFFRLEEGWVTPKLTGTFLDGITRDTVLSLGQALGLVMREGSIAFEDIRLASKRGDLLEAFGTGTAAGIVPIRSLCDGDTEACVAGPTPGPETLRLQAALAAAHRGETPGDPFWCMECT